MSYSLKTLVEKNYDGSRKFETKTRDEGSISLSSKSMSLKQRWFTISNPTNTITKTSKEIDLMIGTIIKVPCVRGHGKNKYTTNNTFRVLSIFSKDYNSYFVITESSIPWTPNIQIK